MTAQPLRLVTRSSALARIQTELAAAALKAAFPGLALTTLTASTTGDRDRSTPLAAIGGRGVFVDGVRRMLLSNEADVAVHSLKDVPTAAVAGLAIAAILKRGEERDVFIGRAGIRLADLAPRSRVGTSSTRRRAMLASIRPDLEAVDLRGNVDTRIRKVDQGEIEGAILAGAGLLRLGHDETRFEWLPTSLFLPAPGQGAIALECRANDDEVRRLLSAVDHAPTRKATDAERAFLGVQGSNCALPVGAFAEVQNGLLRLRAALTGRPEDAEEITGPDTAAAELGARLGRQLRRRLDRDTG